MIRRNWPAILAISDQQFKTYLLRATDITPLHALRTHPDFSQYFLPEGDRIELAPKDLESILHQLPDQLPIPQELQEVIMEYVAHYLRSARPEHAQLILKIAVTTLLTREEAQTKRLSDKKLCTHLTPEISEVTINSLLTLKDCIKSLLEQANIRTIDQLVQKDWRYIRDLRGIGVTYISDLNSALKSYGVHMRGECTLK